MYRLSNPETDAGFGISICIESTPVCGTEVSFATDPRHGLDIHVVVHMATVAGHATTPWSSAVFQTTIGPIRQYVE